MSNNPPPLAGRVALVTGGSRGIGEGIARSLAEAGARVMVADVDLVAAESAARSLQREGFAVRATGVDVSRGRSVTQMIATTMAAFGKLDIAVNNAGVLGLGPLETISEAEWDRVFAVNARGVFLSCQAEIKVMRAAGTRDGRIINVASIAGKVGYPLQAHYCASKFAVVGFTNSIAKEVAKEGITVNALCPGVVGTAMWRGPGGVAAGKAQDGESEQESWERHQQTLMPQGEAQTVEDMGAMAVFLATAPHITGQAIAVDGGATL